MIFPVLSALAVLASTHLTSSVNRCLAAAVVGVAATASPALASAANQAPPETVAFVDLERYAGSWYEIASIPNRFQKHCRGNTMASYRPVEGQRIEVINSCLDEDGSVDTAQGIARVVDTSSNAKLEVSFVSLFGWQLFWGDYWVLELAPDYSYVIVGTPNYRYGWLLSRTPLLSAELRGRLDEHLRSAGYDPAAFVDTPQGIE
jgi:apolipoprotein D and lipocalin family protein